MFYQLTLLLSLFAFVFIESSVYLVITRKFSENRLFVLLEETDRGLSFPRSVLEAGKNPKDTFDNLFDLTTWSLLRKKKPELLDQVDFWTSTVDGVSNHYYFVRLGEKDHISSRDIEEYRLLEKPSNIEENAFHRNWVNIKSLTLSPEHSQFIECNMLSMNDRKIHDELRLISNDLISIKSNVDFKRYLESKQTGKVPAYIPSYKYLLGFLPLRIFNDEFYVLLEKSNQAKQNFLFTIKDPKSTPYASVKDLCHAAVKVLEARSGLKIPLLSNGEPTIINRNKRLVVLSRFDIDRNQYENIFMERIDFGNLYKSTALSIDNFTTNSLVWVNLDDLLKELSNTRYIDLDSINVRTITTAKQKRAAKKKLPVRDAKLEKPDPEKAKKKSDEDSSETTEEKKDSPKKIRENEEIIEPTNFAIEYDLGDLLSSPRNMEIIKTRLLLFRPHPSKDALYQSAWAMTGLSFLVGALIPVLYYNFLLK
jgi:hypothetical protein